jgi:hypothetical protein
MQFLTLTLLAISSLQVSAFPAKQNALAGDCPFAKRGQPPSNWLQERAANKKRSTFDASAQLIDVSGAHA